MSRISSISLLTLFLLNVIGGMSLLLIQRYRRHEVVESIIESEACGHYMTRLHLTCEELEELKWVEDGKEFRYKGSMYDLVRLDTQADGSLLLHCLHDHVETKLYAQIENSLGGSPLGHRTDQLIVIQIFKFLSHYLNTGPQWTTPDWAKAPKAFATYHGSFSEESVFLPSQPPDRA
jgi:hypothetical protein